MVFPFAVHYAEARGFRIYGLPHNQFLIEVDRRVNREYDFVDFTRKYKRLELRRQCRQPLASRLNRSVRKVTPAWVKDLMLKNRAGDAS